MRSGMKEEARSGRTRLMGNAQRARTVAMMRGCRSRGANISRWEQLARDVGIVHFLRNISAPQIGR